MKFSTRSIYDGIVEDTLETNISSVDLNFTNLAGALNNGTCSEDILKYLFFDQLSSADLQIKPEWLPNLNNWVRGPQSFFKLQVMGHIYMPHIRVY